jgi:integrase/recombinase XerD
MNNRGALGSWIRRFLMEYLVGERNLARNTQQSYRDAVRLLVTFVAAKTRKKVDELLVPDVDADMLRAFLRHIEEKRKCSVSSRNQRLAAIHALARFIAERCPEYLDWCAQLRIVKAKRSAPKPVCYLEKLEIDALLDAPNPVTKLGSRDRALLLFLYNSGARAEEAATLCVEGLSLYSGGDGTLSSVRLHGKGGKVSHLSAVGLHDRGVEKPRRRPERYRASVPQSPLRATDTLRHP